VQTEVMIPASHMIAIMMVVVTATLLASVSISTLIEQLKHRPFCFCPECKKWREENNVTTIVNIHPDVKQVHRQGEID
jgi:hypothetical protein